VQNLPGNAPPPTGSTPQRSTRRYRAEPEPTDDGSFFEVEARIRGVTRPGFVMLIRQLLSNPHWTAAEHRESVSYTRANRSRLTFVKYVVGGTGPAAAAVGLPPPVRAVPGLGPPAGKPPGSWEQESKTKSAPKDVTVGSVAALARRVVAAVEAEGTAPARDARCDWRELLRLGQVRFQSARERPLSCEGPSAQETAALTSRCFCRIKRRWTFVHKGEVRYDITEVQEGVGTRGAGTSMPNYEVELEWCGPRAVPDDVAAAKLAFKAADVMRILSKHAVSAPPSAFVRALAQGRLPSVTMSDGAKASSAWSELRTPKQAQSPPSLLAAAPPGADAASADDRPAAGAAGASPGRAGRAAPAAAERAGKRGREAAGENASGTEGAGRGRRAASPAEDGERDGAEAKRGRKAEPARPVASEPSA